MLILMRRTEESIIIDGHIEIKVLKIQGNQVHLGINAPRDVKVYREEVYLEILKEEKDKKKKDD